MLEAAGEKQVWVDVMMRIGMAAICFSLAGACLFPAPVVMAQSAPSGVKVAQAEPYRDVPPRRRPQARLRVTPNREPDDVYPHYNPGPNAKRICEATYVQEFRPSGTVIVPRMHCYWRPG
jgi:hypothetical protein